MGLFYPSMSGVDVSLLGHHTAFLGGGISTKPGPHTPAEIVKICGSPPGMNQPHQITQYDFRPDEDHCFETGCLRDQLNVPSGEKHELCRGVHAEQNAIVQAAYHGIKVKGSVLYCTISLAPYVPKCSLMPGLKLYIIKMDMMIL